MKYEIAEDIQKRVEEISKILFPYIKLDSLVCIRSYGTNSKSTIARCHALSKPMQIALKRKGFYVIEIISERFDKLDYKEQTKILIHELMHIPKSFGGGFIHHNFVNKKNVEKMYENYINLKNYKNNFP